MEIMDPDFGREFSKKINEKKIFALTHKNEGVALIDASNFDLMTNIHERRNASHSWRRVNKQDLTFIKVHWYDPAFGEDLMIEGIGPIINIIFSPAERAAKKIKDIFCEQYPLKEVKYEFEGPMPEVTFALLQKKLEYHILGVKITAIRDADDMIVGVDAVLDIPDDDVFYEKIMDIFKDKFEKRMQKHKTVQPVFPKKACFKDFPETAKVNKLLPNVDLLKKLPEKLEILLLFCYCIKTVTWLYKISESTTTIPENKLMQEFHVFMLDLDFPFLRVKDRKINNQNYQGFYYIYGVDYLKEEKFLKLLDSIIPYPTVFILRLSEKVHCYDSSTKKTTEKTEYYYQVWSGSKSIIQKGIKMNGYYHTDWLHESQFSLTLQGDNIREAFNNIQSQIIHAPAAKQWMKL